MAADLASSPASSPRFRSRKLFRKTRMFPDRCELRAYQGTGVDKCNRDLTIDDESSRLFDLRDVQGVYWVSWPLIFT